MVAALLLASSLVLSPFCHAKEVGIMLRPQNEQQLQASQLLMQGSQLLRMKQPFKARPLMERAAALWPDESHVHFNLGACYQEMGDFPRAIHEYELTIKMDPSFIECLPNIGTCYQLMGEYKQAIDYFHLYLKKNPHADDAPQIAGMIAALERQAGKQVNADPQSDDYLQAVLRSGRLQRWQLQRLPLRLFISNGTDEQGQPVNGFRPYYNELLLQALDTWVKASNYRLAYTLVDNAQNADIICTWTDRPDFLREKGTNVEQGAARVKSRPIASNQDEIVQVRMIVLVSSPTTGANISDEDMKKTCLHEFGHALGLAGHSTNNKDVMFYSESPTVWAALTHRDKNTMAKLYADYPIFSWASVKPVMQVPQQRAMPYMTGAGGM